MRSASTSWPVAYAGSVSNTTKTMKNLIKLLVLSIGLSAFSAKASILFSNDNSASLILWVANTDWSQSQATDPIAPGQTHNFDPVPNFAQMIGYEIPETEYSSPFLTLSGNYSDNSYLLTSSMIDNNLAPVITPVPEPTPASLFLLGFFTFGAFWGFGWSMRTAKAVTGSGHMGTAD